MAIDTNILIAHGAVAKKYKKGTCIFYEGNEARFYYQIIEGTVKLFNTNYDGREFTQMEFKPGSSFGEPPLFINEEYPSTAITTEDSVIMKLSKDSFLKILDEDPTTQKTFLIMMARRIYSKTVTTREIINNTPGARIIAFLNDYKKKISKEGVEIEIPYTRQEIANYTGLRVETVIRTLSKMKSRKVVNIINRKLRF
jgi:CRP/FNR family transcriptional regulator